MSVWADGVWADGVWADDVWFGMGGGSPAAPVDSSVRAGGGRQIRRVEAPWPWKHNEFFFTDEPVKKKPKRKKLVIETQDVEPELIHFKDEPIRAIFPEIEPIKIQIPKVEYRPRKNDDDEVMLLI